MKIIAALFVLSCIVLVLVNSVRVEKHGHQSNTEVIGREHLVAEPKEGEVQRVNFIYPPVRNQ